MNGEPASRRSLALALLAAAAPRLGFGQPAPHPDRRFIERAEAMRQLAIRSGDQPYGAVLVTADGGVVDGVSRVVTQSNPDAHAEREAIREARRMAGGASLAGSVLYSTSRPCRLCEQAAAQAGVGRMFFGERMEDGGAPRP